MDNYADANSKVKVNYRIKESTGGDYEDVDETISQAEITADRVFSIKVIGLKKELYENDWTALLIKPSDFNAYEKLIFDSLSNSR